MYGRVFARSRLNNLNSQVCLKRSSYSHTRLTRACFAPVRIRILVLPSELHPHRVWMLQSRAFRMSSFFIVEIFCGRVTFIRSSSAYTLSYIPLTVKVCVSDGLDHKITLRHLLCFDDLKQHTFFENHNKIWGRYEIWRNMKTCTFAHDALELWNMEIKDERMWKLISVNNILVLQPV